MSENPDKVKIARVIRVGKGFQADVSVSTLRADPADNSTYPDRDDIVWIPPERANAQDGPSSVHVRGMRQKDVTTDAIAKYCDDAMTATRIRVDWALYVLWKCNYDPEVALQELRQRVNLEERWSEEEHDIFRMLTRGFGKDFRRISDQFPEKGYFAVVAHYYHTKKSEKYKIFFNKKDAAPLENGTEGPKNKRCKSCNASALVSRVDGLELCFACEAHFSAFKERLLRELPKCPEHLPPDWTMIADEFQDMALLVPVVPLFVDDDVQVVGPPRTVCHVEIEQTKENSKSAMRRVDTSLLVVKSAFAQLQEQSAPLMADARRLLDKLKATAVKPDVSDKWTKREKEAAFHCLASNGMDKLEYASAVVGSKSVSQIEQFAVEHRGQIEKACKCHRAKCREEVAKSQRDLKQELAELSIVTTE